MEDSNNILQIPEFKVVFSNENNYRQYDLSATLIPMEENPTGCAESSSGRLWLGDRDSCSMVQLRHRRITHCVIAQQDLFGLAREEGVSYCMIDPLENDRECFDTADRYITSVIGSGEDVLVCCQTGLGRGACIVMYILMLKNGWTVSKAHSKLEVHRPGARTDSKTSGFRPDLIHRLIQEEQRLLSIGIITGYSPSVALEGRKLLYLDPSSILQESLPESQQHAASSHPMPLLPITSESTLQLCRSLDCSVALKLPRAVFITSYPKSGTTWLQAIVYHMLALHNNTFLAAQPAGIAHISDFAPFYEADRTWQSGSLSSKVCTNHQLLGRRVFNTHLLPSMLPAADAQYIYVIRSAKDACFSFYHHLSNQDEASGGTGSMAFEQFAAKWLLGELPYGNWAQHVIAWLIQSQLSGSRILLLQYADMVNDLSTQLRRISDFLDLPAITDNDMRVLTEKVCFTGMKKDQALYTPVSVQWKDPSNAFIRKGIVGDSHSAWAEHESLQRQYDKFATAALELTSSLSPQNAILLRSLL